MKNNKKIVTIGGGSGQYTLLSGLKTLENIDITAVVSMVDSGGSTGRLRDELGVLPPGDILKCILALSPLGDVARTILHKRFEGEGRLSGHVAGNMLLTILSQYAGSFPEGVDALGSILNIKGKVLPVTIDKATLVAELDNGERLYGEAAIDVPAGGQRDKIIKTFLVPHHNDKIRVYPPVVEAIEHADYIIIGPGDMYTSIAPNLLIEEVKNAIQKTKAKIIYVANIMTKFGETDGFGGEDFIFCLEDFLGKKIDVGIFNSARINQEIFEKYKKQKADFVVIKDKSKLAEREIIESDLLNTKSVLARHDSFKLAELFKKIINIK